MLRINLHIDDIAVLHTIKQFLGVGSITSSGSVCTFTIRDARALVNVLFPILDQYHLFTTKWLDYLDFKLVTQHLLQAGTSRLCEELLIRARGIMSNMNSGRVTYDFSIIPSIVVEPFWLLGFIEGEGTFGLKNLGPYFQLAQHSRNIAVMEAIAIFLQSLPKLFEFSINSLPPLVTNTLNRSTSVTVLSISNIDALHDYFMFFLLNMPFQTRKSVDFYLWCIALHIHKVGIFYLTEDRLLVYQMSLYINSNRYSSNLNTALPISTESIKEVLAMTPPVTLQPEMLHSELGHKVSRKTKSTMVWVYDDDKLVGGRPFPSINTAMTAIGYSKSSSAGRRNIDTGKLIGGRYKFYSKPL